MYMHGCEGLAPEHFLTFLWWHADSPLDDLAVLELAAHVCHAGHLSERIYCRWLQMPALLLLITAENA